MENTKYKLDENDTIEHQGVTLYRVIALRDIGDMVKKGARGGYIESEKNLSAYRTAWVGDEAKVYGKAIVFVDAQVFGRACVFGGVKVSGDAKVYGDVQVDGGVEIKGVACIFSNHEAMERGEPNPLGELSTNNHFFKGKKMENTKYKLVNTKYKLDESDTIEHKGVTLYRVIALRDIGDMVKKGDRGGYIESEKNLCAYSAAWVGDEAKVYGKAIVFMEAQVFGRACVFGGARVTGDAKVYGDVQVDGDILINEDTHVFSNITITDGEPTPLGELSTTDLLNELKFRGGLPAALAEAALLHIRKSEDYNHKADISNYFPFGTLSYAQMLHTKALRFVSLAQKEFEGGKPNYEGLRDTALDIMNYAGFYVDSVSLD